jgi:hypothetical protein
MQGLGSGFVFSSRMVGSKFSSWSAISFANGLRSGILNLPWKRQRAARRRREHFPMGEAFLPIPYRH